MRYITLFPLILAMLPAVSLQASGLDELISGCDGCHGAGGVSQWADMPTIAGISAFAHSDALYIFRDKARPCRESSYRSGDTSRAPIDMCSIAAELSDEQIEELAAHYAAKKFVAASQQADPELAERGRQLHQQHCERCHTEAGGNPDDDAGILAGQHMEYLRTSLVDYRAGTRETSEKMLSKIEPLSDADIEALVHYYGSRK